jgi:hypothetical protein
MIIHVIEVIIFAFLKYLESWHLRESPVLKSHVERGHLERLKWILRYWGNVRWTELNCDTWHPRMM